MTNAMDKKELQSETLKEIRRAISENDALRLEPDITEEDRKRLEKTAVALRNMEREMLSGTAEGLLDRMEAAAAPIKEMAAEVRSKVTAMNAPAKVLEYIKKVLSFVTGFLKEAGRWQDIV